MDFAPLSRPDFQQAAADLGIRTAFKDARCFGEYRSYVATGAPYDDTAYDWLMIRRGATLAREGYTPPARRHDPHACETCGLNRRTCDCR